MEQRRDVFQAIADPTRRQILGQMLDSPKPQNVNGIAEHFSMTRQAVSLHLKILQECAVLNVEKQGRERLYSLQPQKLAEVADWIEPFRQLWEARFDRMDTLLEKLKKQQPPKS